MEELMTGGAEANLFLLIGTKSLTCCWAACVAVEVHDACHNDHRHFASSRFQCSCSRTPRAKPS